MYDARVFPYNTRLQLLLALNDFILKLGTPQSRLAMDWPLAQGCRQVFLYVFYEERHSYPRHGSLQETIISKYQRDDCKPAMTPMEPSLTLSSTEDPPNKLQQPPVPYKYNNGCIQICETKETKRSKHIETNLSKIRKRFQPMDA